MVKNDAITPKVSRAVVASGTHPTPTPRIRLPLGTAQDVRKELARVYRAMKSGELQTQDGTRLAYVLTELRKAIETCDLERRIGELEQG